MPEDRLQAVLRAIDELQHCLAEHPVTTDEKWVALLGEMDWRAELMRLLTSSSAPAVP